MTQIREIKEAEQALEIRKLSYHFKEHKALDKVDFTVEPGSIHGFVGPNGAGKTTTLKIISTLLTPKKNMVSVFGMDVVKQQKKVRRFTGFMPDNFAMYRPMKVFEYLDFFAAAYGQTLETRNQTVDDVLQLTDMAGRKEDLIKGLSRGMQQRVCLARVLVHDPELLLLDEPASGLDPRARIELMEILRELKRLGKTIFISSHILSELATLCDAVTIIDRGQVKYTGSMAGLLAATAGSEACFDLTLRAEVAGLATALAEVAEIKSVSRREDTELPTLRVTFTRPDPDPGALLAAAIARGAVVQGFGAVERQLDEAFMDLTEPGVRS